MHISVQDSYFGVNVGSISPNVFQLKCHKLLLRSLDVNIAEGDYSCVSGPCLKFKAINQMVQ